MRIILGKINFPADFISGIVLVLTDVFIASYGIAKCVREITRGSVMCRYLTTNELIYDQMNIRAIVCQMISALHMLMYFALT